MKFTPKSDDEINNESLLQPGIYDFEVLSAEDKTSKAGNDMIEVRLNVFDTDGQGRTINDYLMEKLLYKLKHACDACGLVSQYESGTVKAADFVGKTGKLKIKIQEGNVDYPLSKNTVADYVKKSNLNPQETTAKILDDDEIPFG